MWGAGWGYWGWGLWFWIFWAIVLVLLIWGGTSWNSGRRTEINSAEEILRQRYARGEIDKQEYEQKLLDLRRAA